MNANGKLSRTHEFIWPAAGITLGALAALNPFYEPRITLGAGIAAWSVSVILALTFSVHPVAARVGVLVTGLLLAVPCFLRESPLSRGLLMCSMALPFALLALPLSLRPSPGVRERLTYVFTWLGTHETRRRSRKFETVWLLRLIAATAVFAGSMACVKAVPANGLWLLIRWFAGGIMIFAWAEMATACHEFLLGLMGIRTMGLMRSPHLSTSIGEFWSKRWNTAASLLVFNKFCFAPLARRNVAVAVFVSFLLSAILHFLVFSMAIREWEAGLMCGAFFLSQPLLIGAERWMEVRRWQTAARRAWTLAALTATSPLFVEAALQIFEPSWGPPGYVLIPTIVVLACVVVGTEFFAIGFLFFGTRPVPSRPHQASSAYRQKV